MKTLENHKLLIDAECPMCEFYCTAFQKVGMISQSTRYPYQEANTDVVKNVDMQLAKNQIALVYQNDGSVKYGIEAFLKILSPRFPLLVSFISLKWVKNIFRLLYNFISYNRKIIVPPSHSQSCVPDFKLDYRVAYIFLTGITTATFLTLYFHKMDPILHWPNIVGREYFISFGQIFWQLFWLNGILKNKKWDYVGHMMTISSIGVLLLIPFFVIGVFITFATWMYVGYFAMVVIIMVFLHLKRTTKMNLGYLPTLSWIGYRFFILMVMN